MKCWFNDRSRKNLRWYVIVVSEHLLAEWRKWRYWLSNSNEVVVSFPMHSSSGPWCSLAPLVYSLCGILSVRAATCWSVSWDADGSRRLSAIATNALTRSRTQRQTWHELPHVRHFDHARLFRHKAAWTRPDVKGKRKKIYVSDSARMLFCCATLTMCILACLDSLVVGL